MVRNGAAQLWPQHRSGLALSLSSLLGTKSAWLGTVGSEVGQGRGGREREREICLMPPGVQPPHLCPDVVSQVTSELGAGALETWTQAAASWSGGLGPLPWPYQ